MSGALSHVRVLDLSRILAGPSAAQILADLGAEVIKVERPGRGDDTRSWGPPWLCDREGRETGESAYFLSANRGKRSVAVDIAHPEGQRVVRELAARSDVLLENFKVGGLAAYGLDYATLAPRNRGLVYCSITGFGQTGPYRHRPGYDFLIQGMGGLMSVTGEADDRPGGGPQKVGVALADVLTGLHATTAVLAALAHRERTGQGQHVDLSLLDVQVSSMANQALNYLISNECPRRLGNAHPNIVPYQTFRAADGFLIVAVGNDEQFRRLCGVIGRPELADDARFRSNGDRVKHREVLEDLLAKRLRTRSVDAWVKDLEAAGVPAGPINTLDRVFEDPQVRHRGMRVELPHQLSGVVPLVASPLRLSETPVRYQGPPPLLGEHTEAVLGEVLSLSPEEIRSLRAQGAIATDETGGPG